MSSLALFGVFLAVASLSTFVVGDPQHICKIEKMDIKNYPNSMLGEVKASLEQTDRTTLVTMNIPVKQELPPSTLVKFNMNLGPDSFEKEMEIGDALEDKTIGEDFVATAEGFPKGNSIPPGDYSFKSYKANMDPLPSGAEGQLSGVAIIEHEGQTLVEITFEGEFMPKPEV